MFFSKEKKMKKTCLLLFLLAPTLIHSFCMNLPTTPSLYSLSLYKSYNIVPLMQQIEAGKDEFNIQSKYILPNDIPYIRSGIILQNSRYVKVFFLSDHEKHSIHHLHIFLHKKFKIPLNQVKKHFRLNYGIDAQRDLLILREKYFFH